MPKFNMNNHVWVKLTEKGFAIHREKWEPYSAGNYQAPEVSVDGWSRFQLHDLMHTFGHACTMGSGIPFKPVILLDCDRPVVIPASHNPATK